MGYWPVRKCRAECASRTPLEMPTGEEKRFAVARGSKIAHTVGIETIEYGQALVWRGVRSERIRNADGLTRRLRRVILAPKGGGLSDETTASSGPRLRRTLTLWDLI